MAPDVEETMNSALSLLNEKIVQRNGACRNVFAVNDQASLPLLQMSSSCRIRRSTCTRSTVT